MAAAVAAVEAAQAAEREQQAVLFAKESRRREAEAAAWLAARQAEQAGQQEIAFDEQNEHEAWKRRHEARCVQVRT